MARAKWRERWLIVEAQVHGNPFFLPSGFSACDIYIAVVSRWAQQDEWRPANLPQVERLTAAVASMPGLDLVWQRHNPAQAPARFQGDT